VEKTILNGGVVGDEPDAPRDLDMSGTSEEGPALHGRRGKGQNKWIEMTIEIPGYRDDDSLPIFLAAMLSEALHATGDLADKLWISRGWHWRLYIDVRIQAMVISRPKADQQSRSSSSRHHYHTLSLFSH
jgi:exosome complex component RRP42